MKSILLILAIFSGHIVFGQTNPKIDSSNYYKYFSPKNLKGKRLTTDWLRLGDVVPIMLEELKKAGYDWLYDRTIYKLKNDQVFNISAYSRKSNIGFLYIEGHNLFPDKSHRDILFQKDNSSANFVECIETFSGEPEFVKITEIPSNIFILKEDCYFFQYTDNIDDNNILVTREIAIGILRQDIRRYLSTAPNPKK
jgi:hypothetical protein